MRVLKRVWLQLPSTVLIYFQDHIKVIPSCTNNSAKAERQATVESDRRLLESRISNLVTERSRVAIEHLLNESGEEDCVESFDAEEVLFQDQRDVSDSDGDLKDPEPLELPLPPLVD